ncbi:cytidylate kinase [Virgibacillus phasianinus]|uniref:Cytidylate kinase n=1 Tax=Virgibacillus phasianinus TaxID=2017483 RepID=A0A220U8J7_9BACI|nr:(d)CMP kinase [Virgibacillus phasianinus]ASK64420.1 cytidylate kinase [Virgibacillus phasianinus]
MRDNNIAIAIDGPAAAGKSTVAKLVAKELAYIYIDTGAMYRSLTLKALNEHVSLENEVELAALLSSTSIELRQSEAGQKIYLDNRDVTRQVRSLEVTNNVSYVAKHASVRKEMVKRQQALTERRGVVMDGRDIGTHVIPDAEVKIFLHATVEERAKRRYEENVSKGFASDLEALKKEIEQRDLIDTKRESAPLIKADDAIEIDTTSLSIDDVADRILGEVTRVLKE